MRKHLSTILIAVIFGASFSYAQSVADAAQQERKKEAVKDPAVAPKVVTNDDLTETAPN